MIRTQVVVYIHYNMATEKKTLFHQRHPLRIIWPLRGTNSNSNGATNLRSWKCNTRVCLRYNNTASRATKQVGGVVIALFKSTTFVVVLDSLLYHYPLSTARTVTLALTLRPTVRALSSSLARSVSFRPTRVHKMCETRDEAFAIRLHKFIFSFFFLLFFSFFSVFFLLFFLFLTRTGVNELNEWMDRWMDAEVDDLSIRFIWKRYYVFFIRLSFSLFLCVRVYRFFYFLFLPHNVIYAIWVITGFKSTIFCI